MPPDGNTWEEYQKLVLSELQRIGRLVEEERKEHVAIRMDFLKALAALQKEFAKEMEQQKIDIAMLKVKAGVWGMIGGAIPVAVAILVWLAQRMVAVP